MENASGHQRPALLGMIHVPALPGTPAYQGASVQSILEHIENEAREYESAAFDGVILENMHDRPYLRGGVGPEITALMTAACRTAREHFSGKVGVQILAAANRQALAVALAAGLDFIRAEGFVFAHIADEGLIQAQAGELLRYRKAIGASHIQIWADIKKKHSSHAITADLDLLETARAAEFFQADGLIITGTHTGVPAQPDDLASLKPRIPLPVYIGSGVNASNAALYSMADGLIVGSSLKVGGHWAAPLDPAKLRDLRRAVNLL